MEKVVLRADCSKCAALCCVALAFDQSGLFAFDKKGGEACPNLSSCGECGIYSSRSKLGFGGCVGFDCYGAGQRVSQTMFHGRTWFDDPQLQDAMSRTFIAVYRSHQCLVLIRKFELLVLTERDRKKAKKLAVAIEREAKSDAEFLSLSEEARDFLATLKAHFTCKS